MLNEAISLAGEDGTKNIRKLIAFTMDDDPINRNWAAVLLSQQDIDTEDVRGALFTQASEDSSAAARAEAILGLAQRAPDLALPLIKRELASGQVTAPFFKAAELIADKSLIVDLCGYASPSGNTHLDGLALDALHACKSAS